MATTKKPSEKARAKGPATYDRLEKKQARTRNVPVYLDDELAEKVGELRKQIEKDRLFMARVRGQKGEDPGRQAQLDQRLSELEELEAELEEQTVVMRFRAIGRKRLEALMEEHEPTEANKAEAKNKKHDEPEFNPDTFPSALVAVSCVEPEDLAEGAHWDAEEKRTRYPRVEQIFDDWNAAEIGQLFAAAWEVNTQRRVVDLGNG